MKKKKVTKNLTPSDSDDRLHRRAEEYIFKAIKESSELYGEMTTLMAIIKLTTNGVEALCMKLKGIIKQKKKTGKQNESP